MPTPIIRMFVNPPREIASLQGERRRWPDMELAAETRQTADVPRKLYDAQMTFDLGTARRLAARTRGIEITYDVAKELLAVEKLEGGRTYRAKVRPQKGTLKLRVLLDRCSVDLFANDEQVYLMGLARQESTGAGMFRRRRHRRGKTHRILRIEIGLEEAVTFPMTELRKGQP